MSGALDAGASAALANCAAGVDEKARAWARGWAMARQMVGPRCRRPRHLRPWRTQSEPGASARRICDERAVEEGPERALTVMPVDDESWFARHTVRRRG